MYEQPEHIYTPPRFNSFMVLSLCFGILSVLSCSVIFFALPAGGLSILFAILSKGNDKKFQPLSLAGIGTSAFGILVSLAITIGGIYLFMTNDYYHNQLNATCKQLYNVTFDQMIQEMYPNVSLPGISEGK